MLCNRDCFNCVFDDCIEEAETNQECAEIEARNLEERLTNRNTRYYDEHKEEIKARSRAYYHSHKEYFRNYQAQPEQLAKRRAYYHRHKHPLTEEEREKRNRYAREYYHRRKAERS